VARVDDEHAAIHALGTQMVATHILQEPPVVKQGIDTAEVTFQDPWHKFPKVSTLIHLSCEDPKESTFENLCTSEDFLSLAIVALHVKHEASIQTEHVYIVRILR
jgi:hypothetical protein